MKSKERNRAHFIGFVVFICIIFISLSGNAQYTLKKIDGTEPFGEQYSIVKEIDYINNTAIEERKSSRIHLIPTGYRQANITISIPNGKYMNLIIHNISREDYYGEEVYTAYIVENRSVTGTVAWSHWGFVITKEGFITFLRKK